MATENILAKAIGQDESQMAAVEKQDLLARLLGRLAHEIRNPLSSLDIHVQLLEEDLAKLAPETKKSLKPRLEIIHGELHRLESIVERFLRLAGPSALDLELVEIPKIVTHVCELLRAEASTRQIEIVTQIEHGLPPVTADPIRLTQALMNLVINAVQAMPFGGKLTIETRNVEVDESYAHSHPTLRPCPHVMLAVSDTGAGMTPETQEHIFVASSAGRSLRRASGS